MIVSCDACGKKYEIREDQLSGGTSWIKCTACGHQFSGTTPTASRTVKSTGLGMELSDDRKKKVRFGLIFKVVSLMLIVSLVPLATFWGINFVQSNARTKQDTEVLISQITKGLADQVDEWIDKNIRVLNTLARLDDIQSMRRDKQAPMLKAISEGYPWAYLVFTVNPSGENVARSDGKGLRNYGDRSYFKKVMSGRTLAWQTLIGKTSKKPALVLAVPIKRKGKLVGVLASAMTIDAISERVATWRRGTTGHAFLVDETGKVVAHQISDYALEQKNLSSHPLVAHNMDDMSGTHYFKDEDGEANVGHIIKTKYGWGMAVQQSELEVFEALAKSQRLAYLLLGITVVVVSLVAFLLGRAIVVPIRRLTDVAERISKGELDMQINITSKDEIAVLGNAISRLRDSMRLSIRRFSRRKKSERKA